MFRQLQLGKPTGHFGETDVFLAKKKTNTYTYKNEGGSVCKTEPVLQEGTPLAFKGHVVSFGERVFEEVQYTDGVGNTTQAWVKIQNKKGSKRVEFTQVKGTEHTTITRDVNVMYAQHAQNERAFQLRQNQGDEVATVGDMNLMYAHQAHLKAAQLRQNQGDKVPTVGDMNVMHAFAAKAHRPS